MKLFWKYRVRDCKLRMTGHYDSAEEVLNLFEFDRFITDLIRSGYSVSDGVRYKVDVRGSYFDKTWEI